LIAAVLFDFDGVLAESIDGHVAAWREVLPFEPDPMLVRLNEGRPARLMAAALCAAAGIEVDAAEAQRLADLKNEAFRRRPKPRVFPEIPPLLQWLCGRGVRTAVVTGTRRANLDFVLGEELLAAFDAVVVDGDYVHPKPDPQPFLLAAERLGVPSGACVVVENAPNGIRAARSAGMRCIAIMSTLPREPLAGADVTLECHAQLPDVLASWIDAR
jgi:beta-phosphoglucomutase